MSVRVKLIKFLLKRQFLILKILANNNHKEMCGLDIVKESKGKLRRASIYVYLQNMKDEGLIYSRKERINEERIEIPRTFYSITEKGYKKLLEFNNLK